MKRINIEIKGTTPLICNKFTDAAALKASKGVSSSASGRDKGSPKAQAETKLYVGLDGETLMIPQPNVMRCIIDGGTFFKIGKSKITSAKSSIIPGCVEIEQLEMKIETVDGWTVDSRAVRVPQTGGRILCHRPMFNDWKLNFELILDDEILSSDTLRGVIDASGKRIGLGDFRPACKGPYGRFVVTQWSESDN